MTPQILIVDDDASIREAIAEYLSKSDYRTEVAGNADEAIERLAGKNFDVVITDIIMNGMDGLQLTEHIKSVSDTAVIIITGYIRDYTYEIAIHKGADDFVFKPFRLEELLLRLKRVLREREIARERNHILEEFKILSITDHLTRLYNSRHFHAQLETEVIRHERYQRPLSLLMIDIDHFKRYNDAYGHMEGDRVLHCIGKAIAAVLRTPDTAYRYGGEEFTILLPETDLEAAIQAAERIKEEVEAQMAGLGCRFDPITLSIGATEYRNAETAASFMKRADKAMYKSKSKGRNCISTL
ncbi:MAG: diguanylate cyclase [Desulfosalsimonadaceae bacterium]